jgi:hypothetical protein
MLEAHSPQRTAGCVVTQSPLRREARSRAAGHVAHRSPPSGSGAPAHVATLDPSLSGRRDPVPLDTWQHMGARSTPCLELKLVQRGTRSVGNRHCIHLVFDKHNYFNNLMQFYYSLQTKYYKAPGLALSSEFTCTEKSYKDTKCWTMS